VEAEIKSSDLAVTYGMNQAMLETLISVLLLLLSYLLSIRAILCLLDESFSMCLLLQ
jgi:hypothetical protein